MSAKESDEKSVGSESGLEDKVESLFPVVTTIDLLNYDMVMITYLLAACGGPQAY